MKRRNVLLFCIAALAVVLLSTTAFAIDESQVESAIAASSREEVAGNIFIWFLCAVGFLKISQKIDSFMTSLGLNVGRTGGSMLGELMIAGRAIGAAVKGGGGNIGSVFNRASSSHSSTTNQAAGQGFQSTAGGLIGVAQRAAGNAAVSSATGRASGLGSVIGGTMFASSMKNNGKFATDVVSTVATGDIASVGTISGPQAAEALTNYLGYGSASSGAGSVSGQTAEAGTAGAVYRAGGQSVSPGQPSDPVSAAPVSGFTSESGNIGASPGAGSAPGSTGTVAGRAASAGTVGSAPGASVGQTRSGSPKTGELGQTQMSGSSPATPGGHGSAGIPRSRSAEHDVGFAASPASASVQGSSGPIPGSPGGGEDVITPDGGTSSYARFDSPVGGNSSSQGGGSVSRSVPSYRDVEIGGGRITGYETPAEGGSERQFAMYNTAQYMEPRGDFEKVETVDGQTWYKQYAEPTVQKTPYEDESGRIQYDEKIVEQLPQIPKRKDKV